MRLGLRQGLLWLLGLAALLGFGELALRVRCRRRALARDPAKANGVTVVALGDSIVFGWPGAPADAWPARLEARLRAGFPAVGWQVINAGVPGDTAPLGGSRFARDVAAHRPDAALIAFGLNDCNLARHALDRWYERRVPAAAPRSYLWRAAAARLDQWGRRLNWAAAPMPEAQPHLAPRTTPAGFAAALAALIVRSRGIGARPVLLTTSPLAATAPDARIRAGVCDGYNDLIRATALESRVLLVDLAAGHGARLPADAHEADGIHMTAAGQGWIAERVYTTLAANGFWADLARCVMPNRKGSER